MKTCFLYPGQGAQFPAMGKDLFEKYPAAKDMFKLASDVLERDMEALIFEGDAAVLGRTDNTQPAITVVNLAVKNVLGSLGINSDGCAGHSLGEWAAYADAGVLTDEEVLKAVALRGKYMHEAGEKACGEGADSSMAAVIGLDLEKVEAAIKSIDGAFMANWNAPTQIVISGTQDGLEAAEGALKEAGARRVIRLKVSAPCHSPLLDEAKEKFTGYLDGLTFKDPSKSLYSNVSGKLASSGAEAKELALKQIVSSVLWVDEEKSILADGYDIIIEAGPGKVLSGLMKSVTSDILVQLCGTAEQIETVTG
ncbi:MAG: ACP S-malonyltransferase [Spirochaetales bacterium]|uniref:Malonyl CoA-acyl carrier protein transacylase n=1 Tax=Candidatus Thalassospirochaeta sargassi TaxID=3119039 RepID=A0AAJ1IJK9_9SPIO|nr:ACP S-malonyltransferase [Spirochaetales bacterium]